MMKFSIIIPVYNIENYIEDCVNSVIAQEFDDYEIILVEAESGDRSREKCELLKEKYPDKVQVIYQENKGLSYSRNEGVKNASGEYLIFIDGDDRLEGKNVLGCVARKADGCDIVSYPWREFYSDREIHFSCKKGALTGLDDEYDMGSDYLADALMETHLYQWYAWRYAYRREFWNKQCFEYRIETAYEDIDITYDILLKAKQIKVMKTPAVYCYRVRRSTSMSNLVNVKNYIDALKIAGKNIADVEIRNDCGDTLKKMLKNNFSCHYYAILAVSTRVTVSEERKRIKKYLKEYMWITGYTTEKRQKFVRLLLKVSGISVTMRLLNLRMRIKHQI